MEGFFQFLWDRHVSLLGERKKKWYLKLRARARTAELFPTLSQHPVMCLQHSANDSGTMQVVV